MLSELDLIVMRQIVAFVRVGHGPTILVAAIWDTLFVARE
jgi:hypothetical protein